MKLNRKVAVTSESTTARAVLVVYLANFLAGIDGFSNPVTTEHKEQAKSMADDILALLSENNTKRV